MDPVVPAFTRDRGLADLRMLTIAAALFAFALTIVFSAVAAIANSGLSDVQAATTSTPGTDDSLGAGTPSGDDQLQQAPAPTPAQPNRQPSVVTGGSH